MEAAHISPARLKQFVSHLALASVKQEQKQASKRKIEEHITELQKLSLNKRSTKKEILDSINSLKDTVSAVIRDERQILTEQKTETRVINELKTQVAGMNDKLIHIGKEYAEELEDRDRQILELKETVARLRIEMGEKTGRQDKVTAIEQKVKNVTVKQKNQLITELERQVKSLETRHKQLQRSGKHKKADLDRVKQMLTAHKKKISSLKNK